MFYVGGPGRTYDEMRLDWTDLRQVGFKLRPGREAASTCALKCQA